MMTALLLYAYCSGLYSSRRIAKACAERVDFMMIVAHDAPDFSHDRRLQEASSAGAGEAVFAGAEAGGKSRAGEAGACRARRHEDQGERLQTQGDELRTHEDARDGTSRRSGSLALRWGRR